MANFFQNLGSNVTKFTEDPKKSGFSRLDNVEGHAYKNLRMMQLFSLVLCVISILCVISLGIANMKERLIPVIVTVNPEGKAEYVGTVDKSLYGNRDRIPEIAKVYQMELLIKRMFTIVVDWDAQLEYTREAAAVCQANASSQLDLYFKDSATNPFNDFGEYTQSVKIESPLKQTDKTYFINFTVTRKNRHGYVVSQEDFTMLVNLDFFDSAPKSNPLGIYITNFDIKRK